MLCFFCEVLVSLFVLLSAGRFISDDTFADERRAGFDNGFCFEEIAGLDAGFFDKVPFDKLLFVVFNPLTNLLPSIFPAVEIPFVDRVI